MDHLKKWEDSFRSEISAGLQEELRGFHKRVLLLQKDVRDSKLEIERLTTELTQTQENEKKTATSLTEVLARLLAVEGKWEESDKKRMASVESLHCGPNKAQQSPEQCPKNNAIKLLGDMSNQIQDSIERIERDVKKNKRNPKRLHPDPTLKDGKGNEAAATPMEVTGTVVPTPSSSSSSSSQSLIPIRSSTPSKDQNKRLPLKLKSLQSPEGTSEEDKKAISHAAKSLYQIIRHDFKKSRANANTKASRVWISHITCHNCLKVFSTEKEFLRHLLIRWCPGRATVNKATAVTKFRIRDYEYCPAEYLKRVHKLSFRITKTEKGKSMTIRKIKNKNVSAGGGSPKKIK